MEEYCQKANEYLRDGHSSPSFKNIIPDAVAGALAIRIQVISTDIAQEDQFFGPDHESSRVRIQLLQDASLHYNYTMPAADRGSTTFKCDNQLSASIKAEIPPAQHTPIKVPVDRPAEVSPAQHIPMKLTVSKPTEIPSAQHTPMKLPVDRPAEILSAQHTPLELPVDSPAETTPAQPTPLKLPANKPAEIPSAQHTPIKLPVDSPTEITPAQYTPIEVPVDWQAEVPPAQHIPINLPVNKPAGIPPAQHTAMNLPVNRLVEVPPAQHIPINLPVIWPGETADHTPNTILDIEVPSHLVQNSSGLTCRRQLQFSSPSAIDVHLNTGSILKKQECCICKQRIQPSDHLFNCKNSMCTVSTHYECEYKSRERWGFVHDFGKCEHCRTCKECNTVMGRANEMCKVCVGYAHVACVRRAPGQIEGDYVCKECRV